MRNHKSKLVQKLAEKVQAMSQEEALAKLQPEAKQKEPKVEKKNQPILKASLKSKPSAKNKPLASTRARRKVLRKHPQTRP